MANSSTSPRKRGRPPIMKHYDNPLESPMAHSSLQVQKLGPQGFSKPMMKISHVSTSSESTPRKRKHSSSDDSTPRTQKNGTTHEVTTLTHADSNCHHSASHRNHTIFSPTSHSTSNNNSAILSKKGRYRGVLLSTPPIKSRKTTSAAPVTTSTTKSMPREKSSKNNVLPSSLNSDIVTPSKLSTPKTCNDNTHTTRIYKLIPSNNHIHISTPVNFSLSLNISPNGKASIGNNTPQNEKMCEINTKLNIPKTPPPPKDETKSDLAEGFRFDKRTGKKNNTLTNKRHKVPKITIQTEENDTSTINSIQLKETNHKKLNMALSNNNMSPQNEKIVFKTSSGDPILINDDSSSFNMSAPSTANKLSIGGTTLNNNNANANTNKNQQQAFLSLYSPKNNTTSSSSSSFYFNTPPSFLTFGSPNNLLFSPMVRKRNSIILLPEINTNLNNSSNGSTIINSSGNNIELQNNTNTNTNDNNTRTEPQTPRFSDDLFTRPNIQWTPYFQNTMDANLLNGNSASVNNNNNIPNNLNFNMNNENNNTQVMMSAKYIQTFLSAHTNNRNSVSRPNNEYDNQISQVNVANDDARTALKKLMNNP